MVTIGIIVDNYKVSKFKIELFKSGFIHSAYPFMKDTTLIKIYTDDMKVFNIKNICAKLEIDFKQSN